MVQSPFGWDMARTCIQEVTIMKIMVADIHGHRNITTDRFMAGQSVTGIVIGISAAI